MNHSQPANRSTVILAVLAMLVAGNTATAQCTVYDFENFTPGTVATNLIPGVTITCDPESCGGGIPVAEIYELHDNPDGPTNVVIPRTGCPDFSPDALLLTFDENLSFVQFQVGAATGAQIRVRWYNEFGTPLGTRIYDAATGSGLQVTIEDFPIRSVRIGHVGDFFEFIDNLSFGEDTTPPSVRIDSPVFDTCVCGDSVVPITGSVSDDDGTYECDFAEYRSVDAEPGTAWTQFSQACGAFSGALHFWDTTGVPEGRYYVRVTGANSCGLTASDLTVVQVDRSFGAIGLQPVGKAICGTTTIKGGISDACGLTWTLESRPLAGGGWTEIASGASAMSCELADWDTTTVADGVYEVRLRGTDTCGHSEEVTREMTVDNASGCECSADINGDGVVDVSDMLILLAAWSF